MKTYRIYEFMAPQADLEKPPLDHDFKKVLLKNGPYPVTKTVAGDIVEIVHYANFDGDSTYENPIVKETFHYTNDAAGFPAKRDHKIYWYFSDGTLDTVNFKLKTKPYKTMRDKRYVVKRRLSNMTSRASEVVIGALMAGGMDEAQAFTEGFGYWQTLVDEVNKFESGNRKPLIRRLNKDTTPAWLPGIKDLVIAELSHGNV